MRPELKETAHFYEGRSVGLGRRFMAEVRNAIEQVLKDPEAAPVLRGRVRRKRVWRFPYDLLFDVNPAGVRFVAAVHHKRRPNYWLGRLK
jgi:hypothetical protein